MAHTIPFIEISGKNYDVGFKLGAYSKAVLPKYMAAATVAADRRKVKDEPRTLSDSLQAGADRYPRLMDELRGIADGAGVPFQDLFIFNWRPRPRTRVEACTTLIVPTARGVLLAHNEDWYAGTNDCFLARLRYESGLDVLAICYHGFLPGLSISINQAGLVQALNTVISSDGGAGVPLMLIDRAALEATSIDEAIQIVGQPGRADSENFNFAQGKRAVYVETSAKDHEVVEVTKPAVHTNHFVTPRLKHLEANTRLQSTVPRYERATARLAAIAPVLENRDSPQRGTVPVFQHLVAILSDHSGDPWSICRHGPANGDYGVTLATGVADTADGSLSVCIGAPCRSAFERFRL